MNTFPSRTAFLNVLNKDLREAQTDEQREDIQYYIDRFQKASDETVLEAMELMSKTDDFRMFQSLRDGLAADADNIPVHFMDMTLVERIAYVKMNTKKYEGGDKTIFSNSLQLL
jgi:hypothetical protein